jgi:hypothetical protein
LMSRSIGWLDQVDEWIKWMNGWMDPVDEVDEGINWLVH